MRTARRGGYEDVGGGGELGWCCNEFLGIGYGGFGTLVHNNLCHQFLVRC